MQPTPLLYHTTFQGLPDRNKNMVFGLVDAYFSHARERLEKSEFLVLYQDHGLLAGVMALSREPADEWTSRWLIEKFCVRESKRHAGIGTEMLQYALNDVCTQQPVAVHIDFGHPRFKELERFYAKRGFSHEDDNFLQRTMVNHNR